MGILGTSIFTQEPRRPKQGSPCCSKASSPRHPGMSDISPPCDTHNNQAVRELPFGVIQSLLMLTDLDTEGPVCLHPSPFLNLPLPLSSHPFPGECEALLGWGRESLPRDMSGFVTDKARVPLLREAVRCAAQELVAALS